MQHSWKSQPTGAKSASPVSTQRPISISVSILFSIIQVPAQEEEEEEEEILVVYLRR
jgi:hypothetical protein